MKNTLIATAIVLIFISLFSTSIASELAYTCKIKHVYELDKDGSLIASPWNKQFIGSEFSVSRVTGEIIGEVIPTLLAESKKVIHPGNTEYSFKTIANFKNQSQLLEVKEFSKGDTKPFVAMSMGGAGIVSGVCK